MIPPQVMSSLQAIRDALQQSPDNVSLLLLHGRACLEQLQLDAARESFEHVLELDPSHADAQIGVARVHFMEGDSSGAAVRAERVLLQDEGNAQAHLLLSRVFLSENDRAKAVEHFDLAAQSDGTVNDPALERELGRTARDARRSSPAPSMPEMPGGIEFGEEGEGAQDFYDDPFDEPPYDWRPETFFAPGDPQRFTTTFADVGGMEELKEEIRLKIIYPLQYPDLYKAYGRSTGGGILIYGPPGCGKTLLLRAVAGEVPCNYLSVGLHEIFDPYFGSTERNLHQIFETARANAPCVLVFDDLDSLAQDRRHVRESQMRNLVNQFLHELDGLRENQRVLVIGATNQPWQIDPAFRRPGRFDQAIFVRPPDDAARAQIIALQARDKPISKLDVPALVEATAGFSGADIEWVFGRAAEMTLSAAIHSGQAVPIPMDMLLSVARGHSPTTQSWFEGVRDHATQAAPDGFFNEVRKFLNAPSSKER